MGVLGKLVRQHGKGISRKKSAELISFFEEIAARHHHDDIVFLCIGTDCSSGDALGPLVGSQLQELGYAVIGTLEEPCDGNNYQDMVSMIGEDKTVIAIDACLGAAESVGCYLVSSGPLQPGQATGGNLLPSGNYSLAAVVNVNGPRPYTILQMTSLHRVMNMSQQIVTAVNQVFQKPQKSLILNHKNTYPTTQAN